MISKGIFKQRNQDISDLFEAAGHPSKVMCVAIDYAKKTHTAIICNGQGNRLKASFNVHNTPEGLTFLTEKVHALCTKHCISREHVFMGGEDCGTFALNFIHALSKQGFLVLGVNPKDAKEQRASVQASTDKLDVLGIAKMLLDQRGTTRSGSNGGERLLRNSTRHRSDLVRSRTATSNRIHSLVDQLFPGFLDEALSGIVPFSASSLWLMEDRFSPQQIAARSDKVLIKTLRKHRVPKAEEKSAQLKSFTQQILQPVPEMVASLQSALTHEILLYRQINACIEQAEKEIARQLALLPGAMLTTIKGTGILLAAGFASEIGPPSSQTSVRRLTSYAGIVPRVKQTGGPEGPARHGSVSRRCNHRLKNVLVQLGNHLGQHGPLELKEDHRRRGAQGQHADFGMARRYLRMALHIMRSGESYVPHALHKTEDQDALRAHYIELWPTVKKKWQKTGALELACETENPLGKWRECIQKIYDIELPLN
jgi:transposase